jgi:hypothetical protein
MRDQYPFTQCTRVFHLHNLHQLPREFWHSSLEMFVLQAQTTSNLGDRSRPLCSLRPRTSETGIAPFLSSYLRISPLGRYVRVSLFKEKARSWEDRELDACAKTCLNLGDRCLFVEFFCDLLFCRAVRARTCVGTKIKKLNWAYFASGVVITVMSGSSSSFHRVLKCSQQGH